MKLRRDTLAAVSAGLITVLILLVIRDNLLVIENVKRVYSTTFDTSVDTVIKTKAESGENEIQETRTTVSTTRVTVGEILPPKGSGKTTQKVVENIAREDDTESATQIMTSSTTTAFIRSTTEMTEAEEVKRIIKNSGSVTDCIEGEYCFPAVQEERKKRIQDVCRKYNISTSMPPDKDLGPFLNADKKERFLFCNNYKVRN